MRYRINARYTISIHALLAESDWYACSIAHTARNFYPRSPCGERRQAQSLKVAALSISIHALLAESDIENPLRQIVDRCISIHALLAESDEIMLAIVGAAAVFLSTLSLRRATDTSSTQCRL